MSSNKAEVVVVVGTGVTGLTVAYHLLSAGYENVTLVSKEGNTGCPRMSANAYAFWVPLRMEDDPRIERWTNQSFEIFRGLADNKQSGVTMRPVLNLREHFEDTWWKDSVPGFRYATKKELPQGYEAGFVIPAAPVITPAIYLEWLMVQIEKLGGKFKQQEVRSFRDISADFIVNCSALGSRQLLLSDNYPRLHICRLQVVRLKQHASNPINHVVYDNDGPNKIACVVPHQNYVQFGGYKDDDGESDETDPRQVIPILERCSRIIPDHYFSIQDVISTNRCLRPYLPSPRLEAEHLRDAVLIHNYGQIEGTGYITSHGTALDVVDMIEAAGFKPC